MFSKCSPVLPGIEVLLCSCAPVLQFGMIIVAAVLTQPEQDINLADCCFIVFLCCVKNFMA